MGFTLQRTVVNMRPVCATMILGLSLLAYPVSAQSRYQSLQDRTNTVTVDVPDSWQETNVGVMDASLQVADETGDVAFVVIAERKEDLFGWNLDRLHYLTMGNLMAVMDSPEIEGPEDVLVDDAPARTVVVRGSANGTQLVYTRTVVDAPEAYVQLIGWTPRSKWEANRAILEGIVRSARLTPPGDGPR